MPGDLKSNYIKEEPMLCALERARPWGNLRDSKVTLGHSGKND